MEDETPQVRVTITTDLYRTADFLRELANAIEEDDEVNFYEVSYGIAEIEWPEEEA